MENEITDKQNLSEKLKNFIIKKKKILLTIISIIIILLIAFFSYKYFETKKKVHTNKQEIKDITKKFKQLKSLVYNYKDDKENEAKQLSDNISKLENEIQNLKKEYEKIISNTTQQIEEFVQKTNLKN